ncbi:MAG: prolipoprotein diacylglyceryl transferase [Christensenellales bacterium]|jgi:phosphatidylglycerol:prolipoprotein diacylglycerol transferase
MDVVDRVAFQIFGLSIYWYGILIAIGVLLAIILSVVMAKRRGYTSEHVYDMTFFIIPLGVIFARLYYVAFEWDTYAHNLLSIFAIRDGGMAIYGAVIGGVIGMFLNSRRKNGIKFADQLDIVAPGLILAQAIGRWGNFFNQEAYGSMVAPEGWGFPLAVYIERLGEWRLATFFYEFVWNIIVFIILMIYSKKRRKSGSVFLMYLCAYGFGRMFIEGLRDDSLWLVDGVIRVSQLLSLILFIVAGIALIIMHKKGAAQPDGIAQAAEGAGEKAEAEQSHDNKDEEHDGQPLSGYKGGQDESKQANGDAATDENKES